MQSILSESSLKRISKAEGILKVSHPSVRNKEVPLTPSNRRYCWSPLAARQGREVWDMQVKWLDVVHQEVKFR